MTVIRPNSISGVTSITALANEINVFKHDGVLAGLQLNGVNHHTSSGVSTFHTVNVLGNLDVAGVLTYQDVTNVDSLGIGTFRTGVNVSGGQLDVGSNIKLGNAGVGTFSSINSSTSPNFIIKDGTTEKGYIGFNANDPFIGRKNGVGVAFQNNKIRPVDGDDGSGSNNTVDIGENTYKFKDAYFSGTVTANSYAGDGSNLTGITGTTINNNADNRLITGSGTANTLEGEANFTFNGSKAIIKHGTTNTVSDRGLMLQASSSLTNGQVLPGITLNPNTNEHRPRAGISGIGHGSSNGTAGMHLIFMTAYRDDGSQLTSSDERVRIDSAGRVGIGISNTTNIFHVSHSTLGSRFSTSVNSNGNSVAAFTNEASADLETVIFNNRASLGSSVNIPICFHTNGKTNEKMRINTGGELWVGTTSGVSNGGYGGISLNGSSGSLLSLMQNGTEYLRLFGDSNPAIQFAGVLRLFSGVSGGSAIWGISPNGTTTGANSVTFNLKSTIQHTVGVMAVSSSYNSGDLYIRIDNIYNLAGNAWWTFGLWIMSNQTVGTLAGHHSAMVHVYITGLGSWSSITTTNIQGSMAGSVSIDQHGTNFVELKLDANNSSRGPCTVLCNGGTFDPPRISFH